VRIVAATHQDLEAKVRQGTFREDLYYRLNVIPIRLPALRERPGDLALLMEHFLREFAGRHGREIAPAPPELLAAARHYPWPGNVRELRNLCERAAVMGWPAVAPLLAGTTRAPPSLAAFADLDAPLLEARAALVERFEREYLVRLLRHHRGKVGEVARAAGIAERNLYEKMKALGLSRDDYR
jgi:two-component system response regulator AtoC